MKKKSNWKKKLKQVLFIVGLLFTLYMFESWGLWGILIFLLVMVCYRFYTQRELFMVTLRDAELRIFGRPLDKKLWDKGEMKNTKFKFVWRKKKDETKKHD